MEVQPNLYVVLFSQLAHMEEYPLLLKSLMDCFINRLVVIFCVFLTSYFWQHTSNSEESLSEINLFSSCSNVFLNVHQYENAYDLMLR